MKKRILLPAIMLFALCSCDKGNSNNSGLSIPKNAAVITNEKGLKAMNGALESMSKYDAISFSSSLDKLSFGYAQAEMNSSNEIVASSSIDASITNAKSKVAVSGLTSATSLNDMSASYTESATIAVKQNGKSLFEEDELTLGYGVYLEESKCYVDLSNEAVKQILNLATTEGTALPDQFYLDVALPSDANITFPLFNDEFFTQVETMIKEALAPYLDEETLTMIQSVGEALLGEFISFYEYDNKYSLVVEITTEKILNALEKLYEENTKDISSSEDNGFGTIKKNLSTLLSDFDHIKLILEFSSTGFLRSAMNAKFGFSFPTQPSTTGNLAMSYINFEMAMSDEMAYGEAVVVETVQDKDKYQKYEISQKEGL